MIEAEKVDTLKRDTPLTALIESRGIQLRKNGKGFVCRCPFHEDKEPSLSVNPETNLWQCFGCGSAGDVIRFVELYDKVDFPEAVRRLSGNGFNTSRKAPPAPVTRAVPTVRQRKLLSRVTEFYHKSFLEDPEPQKYLAGRGFIGGPLFSAYKIGFAGGTLRNVLAAGENDITEDLKAVGILNDKGTEHFYGCVTFPLYDLTGQVCSIYGRRVKGDGPAHLYLPGPREGLFNRQCAKVHDEIILTESVIDAYILIQAGIRNAVPCYGTTGLTASHVKLFKQNKVHTVHIAFDADEAGRKGAETIGAWLRAEGIGVQGITLPDGEDVANFFSLTADAKSRFLGLMNKAQTAHPRPPAVKEKKSDYVSTQYGFTATIHGRRYDVRGIARSAAKLKAAVKGIVTDKGKRQFHVDTVDLYSSRSRGMLARGLSNLFGVDAKALDKDLQRLTELVENYKDKDASAEKEPAPEMDKKDWDEALAMLRNPDMFNEILDDFEILGYTGEEMNKLVCYIAAVSRKMDEPISVMIQSRSAAGKSYLQDTVLSMLPEEDFVKYTRLTDQALFYKDTMSLAHKILAIEEMDGMGGAIYSLRSIQSSRKITIAYTGKDPATGKLRTEENTVEGPIMVFITTTAAVIEGETASRFIFISIDESQEMTSRILTKQRESHTMEGMVGSAHSGALIRKHQAANQLLRPVRVINPYARLLTFTNRSLRARRDHKKYLNLILATCYLFQHQREVRTTDVDGERIEYITVTLEDIDRANRIAGELFGTNLDDLSPPSRKLLGLIREMCERDGNGKEAGPGPGEYSFTRRRIREYSGWSDFQVKTHIRQLEELEYIWATMGRKGKEYIYELAYTGGGEDGKPFMIGLTDIGQLKRKAEKEGIPC